MFIVNRRNIIEVRKSDVLPATHSGFFKFLFFCLFYSIFHLEQESGEPSFSSIAIVSHHYWKLGGLGGFLSRGPTLG